MIEGLKTFGSVVWVKDGECGIAFDGPLQVGDVQYLRHKVATAAGFGPQMKAALDDWALGVAR